MKKWVLKFIYVLLAIFLVFSLTGCDTNNDSSNSTETEDNTISDGNDIMPAELEEGYSLYTSVDGKVSFVYKDTWTSQDGSSQSVERIFIAEDEITIFNYTTDVLPLEYTLDQYANALKTQLKSSLGTITFEVDEKTKVGPYDGYNLVYSLTSEGQSIKIKQVFIIIDKVTYGFTYFSTADSYDTSIDIVNTMLDSVRIK